MTLTQRLRRLVRLRGDGTGTAVRVAPADPDLVADQQRTAFINVHRGPDGGPYRCPCCASITLPERGAYELCPVCFWKDDGQDDHDADEVRGGPNGISSLTLARANYVAFGASDHVFLGRVRGPTPQERPER